MSLLRIEKLASLSDYSLLKFFTKKEDSGGIVDYFIKLFLFVFVPVLLILE